MVVAPRMDAIHNDWKEGRREGGNELLYFRFGDVGCRATQREA